MFYKKLIFFIVPVFLLVACSLPYVKQAKMKGIYHRVKPGENLWQISKAYNINLQELAEINNITDANIIQADSVLFIPDANQIIDDIMTLAKLAGVSDGTIKAEKKTEQPYQTENKREKDLKPSVLTAGDTGQIAEEKIRPLTSASTIKEEDITKEKIPAAAIPVINDGKPDKKIMAPDKDQIKIATVVKELPKAVAPVIEKDAGMKTIIAPVLPAAVEKKEKDSGSKTATSKIEPPIKQPLDGTVSPGLQFDKKRFIWPLQGKVIARFGLQPNGMYLNGIKISAKEGTQVVAAAAGTVSVATLLKGFGETIIIEHEDKFATVYTHLNDRMVNVADRVKKGDKIAFPGKFEGEKDTYLHFEIRQDSKARNPLFFLP